MDIVLCLPLHLSVSLGKKRRCWGQEPYLCTFSANGIFLGAGTYYTLVEFSHCDLWRFLRVSPLVVQGQLDQEIGRVPFSLLFNWLPTDASLYQFDPASSLQLIFCFPSYMMILGFCFIYVVLKRQSMMKGEYTCCFRRTKTSRRKV